MFLNDKYGQVSAQRIVRTERMNVTSVNTTQFSCINMKTLIASVS